MSDIDWKLVWDFDSVERGHSRPRWEYAIIDGGETVAFKEVDPIRRKPTIHYIPLDVVRSVDTDTEQNGGGV